MKDSTTVNMVKKSVKLPNFLIVGAAKSGTTSLYHYLMQHPDVFMSSVKEPKFITSQFLRFPFYGNGDDKVEMNIVKSYDDYCRLFEASGAEKAVGEASADNLYYYERAVIYIKKFLGNPKIIIILRNPVDRAFSAYTHLVRDRRETLTFEQALETEKKRKMNNWEFIWLYKDVGFYYQQVEAYLKHFIQVKIYLYDQMKRDALTLIKDMYEFLEVDSSFIPDVNIKYNVSLIPKSKAFNNFLAKPNIMKDIIKPFLKIVLSEEKIGKIVENLKNRNLSKPGLRLETREHMIDIYHEDILKLQDLIKRDLNNWLK